MTTLAATAADYKSPIDRIPEAQDLCLRCIRKGLTPKSISYRLFQEHNTAVTWRTIYRWAKGEHGPQRNSDLNALRALTSTVEKE